MAKYIAVARQAWGEKIARGARVTIESDRDVEETTGLTFRHEIAAACREQLGVEVVPTEEATLGTHFTVYSEVRYAAVREQLEADLAREAEKEARQQQREARQEAAEQKRQARQEAAQRVGQNDASQPRTSKTGGIRKQRRQILGGLRWKDIVKWIKFAIAVAVLVWVAWSVLKSCNLKQLKDDPGTWVNEQVVKPAVNSATKNTKTTTTTKRKKKSTTTAKKKKSTTATKKKKSTPTTKKKRSTTKRKKKTEQ